MTNDQIRRNDQIRMTKPATARLGSIRHSGLGFHWSLVIGHSSLVIRHSSFVIRHSSFNGLCKSGSCSQCALKKRRGSLHQPTVCCPGFSRSGPPEGATPYRCTAHTSSECP